MTTAHRKVWLLLGAQLLVLVLAVGCRMFSLQDQDSPSSSESTFPNAAVGSAAATDGPWGYAWSHKSSPEANPQRNAWDAANSRFSGNRLYLKIAKGKDGTWYCGEVWSNQALGFGKYEFKIKAALNGFDSRVVLGLFSYLGTDYSNEIDLEFTKCWPNNGLWTLGCPCFGCSNATGLYGVWPTEKWAGKDKKQQCRFSVPDLLNPTKRTITTHSYTWTSESILFESWDESGKSIGSWLFNPGDKALIPQKAMPVHMNLWLGCEDSDWPRQPGDKDTTEVEVVVLDFRYTPECTYSLWPAKKTFQSAGGEGTVNVNAGKRTEQSECPWTAESEVPWIQVTSTSGASGGATGTVGYKVYPNDKPSKREGTIKIAGETFIVKQEAKPACSYTISPTKGKFTAAGGTGTVRVATQAGCMWGTMSDFPWIHADMADRIGSGVAGYQVDPNDTSGPRTGSLEVAGHVVTIVQESQCKTDLTSPVLAVNCGAVSTSGSISFSWSATDNCTSLPEIRYRYRLNPGSSSWSTWSSGSAKSYSSLKPGTYAFRVQAKDKKGNVAEQTCPFQIVDPCDSDAKPPALTLVCGSPSGGSVSYSWSAADDCTAASAIEYRYRLDDHDQGWSAWGLGKARSYSRLKPGTYAFRLEAKDKKGNVSGEKVCQLVIEDCETDAVAPMLVTSCGTPSSSGAIAFSWSATDNCTKSSLIKYRYRMEPSGGSWSSWRSTTSKSYSDLKPGTYTFCVQAKDTKGNLSGEQSCPFVVSGPCDGVYVHFEGQLLSERFAEYFCDDGSMFGTWWRIVRPTATLLGPDMTVFEEVPVRVTAHGSCDGPLEDCLGYVERLLQPGDEVEVRGLLLPCDNNEVTICPSHDYGIVRP